MIAVLFITCFAFACMNHANIMSGAAIYHLFNHACLFSKFYAVKIYSDQKLASTSEQLQYNTFDREILHCTAYIM